MSEIFELLGEEVPHEELPVDNYMVEFDDPAALKHDGPKRVHDEDDLNDEGCTPGGWAKSPTC